LDDREEMLGHQRRLQQTVVVTGQIPRLVEDKELNQREEREASYERYVCFFEALLCTWTF
jgi:hypothetical protein